MNREELIEQLSYFLNPENGIGAALYFVLDEEEETVIRFADIDDDVKNKLKEQFLEYINEKFITNENLSYKNISEADERKNVVYNYDLENRPEALNILNLIVSVEEQPTFDFNNDSLNDLQGYLITLGNEANKLVLYKKHNSMNLLKRDKRIFIIPSNERFTSIDSDAIALDKSFDFMLIQNSLIILKLTILERYFGFEEVIRGEAQTAIQQIEAMAILENIDGLTNEIQHKPFAKKMLTVKNSPVLALPVNTVISFIQNHPHLQNKIKCNDDNTRVNLDTKVSMKLFISLLNDDYLKSGLTQIDYETLAKDKLQND